MKIFLLLCLLLPLRLFADGTTSCRSTLSTGYVRLDLSEICYTQYGDHFLQWQGYWGGNTNKYFTPVASWQVSLSAMATETGWRLPTIKELQLLTTKGLVDVDNLPPDAFAENWMLKQWFIRDTIDTSLIPVADAYLLSSSYQGDAGNGTSKIFALNIATGLIEALASTDFDSKSVYIVKVKQAQPIWVNITTQYADTLGHCLQHTDTLSSGIKVAVCDNTVQQKWLLESNTGFVRSYSGGCLQAKTLSNYGVATYETCSNSEAEVTPIKSDRWDAIEVSSSKVFSSRSNTVFHFYVTSGTGSSAKKGDILVWDYSSDANDTQNIWFISNSL
jgi:hypothetical protein